MLGQQQRPRARTEGSGDEYEQRSQERPRAMSAGDGRIDFRLSRPRWNERHHLLFSRENANVPAGQRDYFDRPRDLRNVMEAVMGGGHDGISHPFERNPSLHWLKYTESPKMQRLRSTSGSRSPERSRSATSSPTTSPQRGADSRTASMDTQNQSGSPTWKAGSSPAKIRSVSAMSSTAKDKGYDRHSGGVGSPYGSPTKPAFQRSASWYLAPELATSEQRRSDKYVHLGYSEKAGVGKHPKVRDSTGNAAAVSWNNRWHLTPSLLGQEIHPNYREFFDNPSRMYTSTTEDWRHMYGDYCSIINHRVPGTPVVNPVYGWHSLRLQKDSAARRPQTEAKALPL